MNRKSRSITRRSSILKIDVNREDDTGVIGGRSRRSSRRVSFAEMCQIKEFPRDSPKVYKDGHSDDDCDGKDAASGVGGSKNLGITGLDKLLTGAIQTPYQDVAEYPIPEMSSESFNIFDINKTVLDTVDMETTQVGGNIDTFLPQMDFQSEPSMELKFDASSFLQSLGGKPSDRLKTMQIYSPNRSNGQSFTPQFNIMEQDKENVIPMEALSSSFGHEKQELPASVDSKMFLQRFFGGTSDNRDEDRNEMEEMEETACVGDAIRMLSANTTLLANNQNNDLTNYFNTGDVTIGIEETKCIGGIVVETNGMDHVEIGKENSNDKFENHMEETKPIGGILKSGNTTMQTGLRMQQAYDTNRNTEDNVTRCFNMEEDSDNGIEETKCVGGILSKADNLNITTRRSLESKEITLPPMEGTEDIKLKADNNMDSGRGNLLKGDKTVNFNISGIQDCMEVTKTVGGFIDKSVNISRKEQYSNEGAVVDQSKMDTFHQTVPMDETVPLGKIETAGLKSFAQSIGNQSFATSDCLESTIAAMEETKPVGGILKSSNDRLSSSVYHQDDPEITKNVTVAMEMTRPVGGFLDKIRKENMFNPAAEECFHKVTNIPPDMEETKGLDRSVTKTTVKDNADLYDTEKTIDYTVAMEETRAVGKILEQTIGTDSIAERKKDSVFNKTVSEPVPIEETRPVGGILNKTTDGTEKFVCKNYTSTPELKDLKAADSPSLERSNRTMTIEETKCVGGILTNNMEMLKGKFENMYNHAHDYKNDITVMEPVQMEETKCVTGVLGKELKGNLSHEVNEKVVVVEARTDTSFKSKVDEAEDITDKHESSFNSDNIVVDEEITFKNSNKRNFDEVRGETLDKNEEKTKEITQTGLAKLKEMLILSKRKTASSLRQGDIRTPSKLSPLFPGSAVASASKGSCSGSLNFGVTKSPVPKRQRLSEGVLGVEELENFPVNEKANALNRTSEDEGLTNGLYESSKLTHEVIPGIDDEEMPDTMHIDLCASSASGDTHSDKNSTNHDDLVSTTVLETNETHSSGNDTRNSSSANLSRFSNVSNKSFAYSFVVPEGPLSLDSFFQLTFSLASKIQGTRCSTIFAPRIDMDDQFEVAHAELTLTPVVQATKKMKELFTQQIQKSEESMEWLEKLLEETQPEVFQLCANADEEELQQITGQLRSLYTACHKEAENAWKLGTKQMFEEALHDIQGDGVQKAEDILVSIKSDSQSVDDLLNSLDDELEDLDKTEKKLEELQQKEGSLNSEMERLTLALQERRDEGDVLNVELQKVQEKQHSEEVIASLKQHLVSHLSCCEWNLDEFEDDRIVFTFLDDKLELLIDIIPGVEEKQICNIVWRPKASSVCRYFDERVAVELALEGINVTSLRQKYTTMSALPKLVHEVSSSLNEIRRFCVDLEEVQLHHSLTVQNNSVFIELWDRETMDFVTVTFIFDPSHPLTNQVKAKVAVRIGTLKPRDIEEKLKDVNPGSRYLSRLIRAINFKQLRNV